MLVLKIVLRITHHESGRTVKGQINGGADETRTRGLRRDRPAL